MHCFQFLLFLFLSSLFLRASLADIVCEDLPRDVCAFSISSSGRRCLLETTVEKDYEVEYECRTSEVMVERMAGYLESDKCVRACGVDRNSTGISSDLLLESKFTAKLCASACSHNCPNIVDLFFNLAAGEGVFLPDLCAAQHTSPRRSMVSKFEETHDSNSYESPPSPFSSDVSEFAPSSEEAPGPISSEESYLAPSSEENPGPISVEESDSAPSSEEASGPTFDEASAPTPSPLGALSPVSILAPGPAPIGTLSLGPAPTRLRASASSPAPGPTPMGILSLGPAPTRLRASASSPTPVPMGALASTPTPILAPTPMGALASSPASVPGPAPMGAPVPTPSHLKYFVSNSISAPSPTPLRAFISGSSSAPTPTPMVG